MSDAAVPSYLEIIDFIASGTTQQTVAEYRPSEQARRRVEELVARERAGQLSPEEKSELDRLMDLEHIILSEWRRPERARSYAAAPDVDQMTRRLVH